MNPGSQDANYLKTLTVLYVEDDPLSRTEIGRFLDRRVGKLICATNGAEGLHAYQSQRPHLVVTDIQMPKLDGLSMACEIRRINPSVPIIATTAFEQSDYLIRSIELGIDRYIVKPINSEVLESALLACAHRLLAEELLRVKEQLEAEAIQNRHHAAMHILLAGVAHDYNNLLQTIFAGVDTAWHYAEPGSKVHRALNLTKTGSAEIRSLSRRLNTLANASDERSETGSLDPLIREVVQESLQGTLVRPEFDLQGEAAKVQYNAVNIAQVIRHLTDNAREAMPRGGTLKVSTEVCHSPNCDKPQQSSDSFLRVCFRDNGLGITIDNLSRIFEPYFSTKERGQQRGMGLGLALCEAIIRAHGGSISVESAQGQGAAFVIHLPAVKRDGP